MNKIILIVVAVVVIAGGGVFLITKNNKNDDIKVTNTNTNQSTDVKTGSDAIVKVDACEVLTESVAKQVLGDGATKGDTSAGNASTDDVSVSNCTYTLKPSTGGSGLQQVQNTSVAGLLVRSAKSKVGADSNKSVFANKPSGAEDVSGYGDQAFWNPQYGQLNILKGGNWYIISQYTGVNSTKGTIDQAKALADAMKSNIK